MQIEDKQIKEIQTRYYKDSMLIASPSTVANQAVADVKFLLSTIEGLKGEVERLHEERRESMRNGTCAACHHEILERDKLRSEVERYRAALEIIAQFEFSEAAIEARKVLGNHS